jgi:membrane-bound lytic murein transglycosylase B
MIHRSLCALTFILLFILCSCSSSTIAKDSSLLPSLKTLIPEVSESPIEYADSRLAAAGLPADFIQTIHQLYLKDAKHWTEETSKIVELNVFGFLGQTNYFLHDSPLAQKKIKRYLKDHRSSFQTLKKKYAVSPETVAALLWVETKHGKTLGSFPMPFVYYSMIIGSHPVYIRSMVALAPEKIAKGNPKNLTLSAVQEKVITRCKSKADWAINELKAAYQIQQEHDFNPFHQKASFAGAFGISQFIPSTYLKLAVSEFRTKPDLYKHSDAILSVGNFLKSYGWKNSDPDAEAKALYAYNHSKDYGAVILKLAEEASH